MIKYYGHLQATRNFEKRYFDSMCNQLNPKLPILDPTLSLSSLVHETVSPLYFKYW